MRRSRQIKVGHDPSGVEEAGHKVEHEVEHRVEHRMELTREADKENPRALSYQRLNRSRCTARAGLVCGLDFFMRTVISTRAHPRTPYFSLSSHIRPGKRRESQQHPFPK